MRIDQPVLGVFVLPKFLPSGVVERRQSTDDRLPFDDGKAEWVAS